jgi:mannitol/fructose-specific phosphotransferase system IIA component (Ntr-type)
VKAIMAFVSPGAATVEHLRFLSGVARLFRSPEALEALTTAHSPDEVIALLHKHGA